MSDHLKLAREIAARTKPRFIDIPRERGGGKVPFHPGAAFSDPRWADRRGISVGKLMALKACQTDPQLGVLRQPYSTRW